MSFEPRLPREGVNVSGRHPLREVALLLGGLVALVVTLVVVVGLTLDRLVPRIPASWEASLLAPDWLDLSGDGDADSRRDALQALVERMAGHWDDAPYPFRLVIWDDEEPNAVALPGGWIALTTGLLDGATSENEVAFVIGHELGHFRNRDHLRGLGRGLTVALVTATLGSGGAAAAADVVGLAGALAERGFGRDQERDADLFGLELVALEYGHVAGADRFFARLPQKDGDALGAYLSTHPLSRERIRDLAEASRRRGWSPEGSLTPLPD